MTIITAHFAYSAKVMERRKRNPSDVRVRDEVMIDLRDLKSDQAPVAIRYKHGKEKYPIAKELRWDGDRLMRPLASPSGGKMTIEGFEEATERGLRMKESRWRDYPFPRLDRVEGEYGRIDVEDIFSLPTQADIQAREWFEHDRDDIRNQVAEIASNLAVIDGEIWIACPEPTWQVGFQEFPSLMLHDEKPTLSHEEVYIRLDEMHVLERVMDDLYDRSDKAYYRHKNDWKVDILIPEAIRFDAINFNAWSLGQVALPTMATEVGTLASTETIRAWCDMRDQFSAWDREDEPTAISLLRSAADFFDRDLHPNPGRKNQDGRFPSRSEDVHLFEKCWGMVAIAAFARASGYQIDHQDAQALQI